MEYRGVQEVRVFIEHRREQITVYIEKSFAHNPSLILRLKVTLIPSKIQSFPLKIVNNSCYLIRALESSFPEACRQNCFTHLSYLS
jgi:hypothetical protein